MLDSISKNIGAPYTSYFGRNLYKTFTETYTLVTEATRQKLCDLFRTWKQPSPVTGQSLFAPDQISKIDGFLTAVRSRTQASSAPSTGPNVRSTFTPRMSQSGLLLQVDRLLQMTRQRQVRNPQDLDANEQVVILNKLKSALSASSLPLEMLPKIEEQLNTFAQKEQRRAQRAAQQADVSRLNASQYGQHQYPPSQFENRYYHNGNPSAQNLGRLGNDYSSSGVVDPRVPSSSGGPAPPASLLAKPDVSDLLSKLQTSPLFNTVNSRPTSSPTPPLAGLASVLGSLSGSFTSSSTGVGMGLQDRPLVQLTNADISNPKPELVSQLYQDMPNQCMICGKRYRVTQAKFKQDHLDWHFRVSESLRDKEDANGVVAQHRVQNRCWYLSCEAWIEFKDQEGILGLFNDIDDAKGHLADEKTNPKNPARKKDDDPTKHKVAIPKNATLSKLPCPVCQEKFETGWDEASESWMWINAIKDKNRIYHYTCFQEVANTNPPGDGGGSLLEQMRAHDRAKSMAHDLSRPQKRKATDHDPALEGGDQKRSMTTTTSA